MGGSPGSWLTAGRTLCLKLQFLSAPRYKIKVVTLTELSALSGRLQQQPQLVQNQRHVHGVTPKSLDTKQERHGRLKLSREEQHLEVEEGLLAGREVGLSCWDKR